MSAIQNGLSEIKFKIPPPVLQYAFHRLNQSINRMPVNIDTIIKDLVINRRVIKDCNLHGGHEVMISLNGLPMQYVDNYKMVVNIPKEMIQGRTIMTPLSISLGTLDYPSSNYGHLESGASQILQQGQAVLRANQIPTTVSTANVRLIGENVIYIEDELINSGNLFLRCIVSDDPEFTRLPSAHWPLFADLCVLATKAWIYVNTIIPLDKGIIYRGQQLVEFKNIIDQYADSNELYDELLQGWGAAAVMADRPTHTRYIKMLMSRN